jgi:hypothetical protein
LFWFYNFGSVKTQGPVVDQRNGVVGAMPAEDFFRYGPNGFDFGLSDHRFGLGPGLLGDFSKPTGGGCRPCQAGQECSSCSGVNGANGQVIDVQFPVPAPGLFPPLPPSQPPKPGKPPIIGDPHAWWNWGDADLSNWLRGDSNSVRTPPEVMEACQKQHQIDEINCMTLGAMRRDWLAEKACREQAMTRFGECIKNGGVEGTKSPPHERNPFG